jgi:hypothetical protein
MIPFNYFPLAFFRHKVRIRLLDEATGHPLTGVVLTLRAEVSDGDPKLSFPINTLVTDHVGYASFSLARFADMTPDMGSLQPQAKAFDNDRVTALRIDAPAVGVVGHDLLAALFTGQIKVTATGPGMLPDMNVVGAQWAANRIGELGLVIGDRPLVNYFDSAFVVQGSRSKAKDDCGCHTRVKGLRSVEDADEIDHAVSPGSFFAQDPVLVGEGGCQTATAAAAPAREVRLFQVVVDGPTTDSIDNLGGTALDLNANPAKDRGVRKASVQRFLQRWTPLGYSLGDIRYSLPLAPGESVNLAVIEWSREDAVTRQDNITSLEDLQHRQRRNRDIDEVVDATLHEDQGGGSFMAGTSGAANASIPVGGVPINFAAGHAIGGGVTHSWGQRDLSADTAQNLRDRLSQTSQSLRTLNSTTVIQATQSEKNMLSSRTVANHNRCHAMTIQYFEVLRNYRVELFNLPALQALLVPFKPIEFDAANALRWEHLLRPALLNPALAEGFEALRMRTYGSGLLESTGTGANNAGGGTSGSAGASESQEAEPYSGETDHVLAPEVNLESSNYVRTLLDIAENSTVQVTEQTDSGWVYYGSWGSDSGAGGQEAVPAAERSEWKAPDAPKYSLVARIGSRTYPVGANGTFTALEAGSLEFFVNDKVGKYTDNLAVKRGGNITGTGSKKGLYFAVKVIAPPKDDSPVIPANPSPMPKLTDASAKDLAAYRATALVEHLKAQASYYNRVVWMAMDRSDLERLLDNADNGRKGLFDGIDSRPVAIWRNYLAFVAPGSAQADSRLPRRPLTNQIIALPSRGVLAEAQLGNCVACEERDATRVQEWTLRADDRAPSLEHLVPGPAGSTPAVGQVQLGAPTLSIQAAPNAPDPTGLAAALTALTQPNVFRNMSAQAEVGALLNKLAEGAFASLPEAQAAAKKAKLAQEEAKTSHENSGEVADPRVANGVSAGEMANRMSLLPELQTLAKDIGLSEQQMQQLALDTLHGNRPTTAKTQTPPATGTPHTAEADEFQIAVRVIDAWDRPAEAEIFCSITDNNIGPQPLLRTTTRSTGISGYGQNGLLPPIKGLTQGLLDLHVQIMETDYALLSSEVRDLFADSVAYNFAATKRFYRFQVKQGFDERRITVQSGETLGNKAASELGATGVGGGTVKKILELSLTLEGKHSWEDEVNRTQTATTEYTLRVPNTRLVVTQL